MSVRPANRVGDSSRISSLIVAARSRACAIPSAHVVETMRPLPVETLAGLPSFVLGASIVRGEPTPVVHLGRLLGDGDEEACGRFVSLRIGARRVALAVSRVIGVRDLDGARLDQLPPLFGGEGAGLIDAVGVLDANLLVALRAMRIVPDAVWEALAIRRAGS
jgi:purine-binding chemotaxis protein CheW